MAALSVGNRGFLPFLTQSEHIHAAHKLSEILTRWEHAKVFLKPVIVMLPQLMIIPVTLFAAGLLDALFSNASKLGTLSVPILLSGVLASLSLAAVAAFLCYALIHASIWSSASPFQAMIRRVISRIAGIFRTSDPPLSDKESSITRTSETNLTEMERDIYFAVVQTTNNDDSLNQASAALRYNLERSLDSSLDSCRTLSHAEVKAVLHLLSPEASLRSNLTAANAVTKLRESWCLLPLTVLSSSTHDILSSLLLTFQPRRRGASSLVIN